MIIKKKNLRNLWLFLLIVSASLIFRVTNLDLIEFKGDEAINLYLSARPIFGHPFPPGSTVSSIGLLNPPLFNYLLFPIVAISRNPMTVSLFIAIINSLTIGFFALLIKHYYRLKVALVATLLMAFSPWAIIYSRKIWTQNLLSPFIVLLLFCLHQLVIGKKAFYWLPLIAIQVIIFQLHQPALFFLILINLFLLVSKVKLKVNLILLGLAIGMIPAIPYLAYLFNNISNPEVFLVAKQRFSHLYFPKIFFRPLQILSQGNFRFILGENVTTFSQKYPLIFGLRKLFYLEYLLIPFGALVFWKNHPKIRFLVLATLGLPLAYFLLHFEPFIHYFIVIMPILFLFLAVGLAYLLDHQNKLIKTSGLTIIILLILISGLFNHHFFSLLRQLGSFKGDYGTAYHKLEKETETRFAQYQNDPHYQEMVLVSYLPRRFLQGNLPVAKMIYDYQVTEKNLLSLEQRLIEVPEDSRVHNQLFAYYSQGPVEMTTVDFAKEKTKTIPGYQTIYESLVDLYNNQQGDQ